VKSRLRLPFLSLNDRAAEQCNEPDEVLADGLGPSQVIAVLARQVRPVKRPFLLLCAWSTYLVSWAIPVVEGGDTLPEGLPGWQALAVALLPLSEPSGQPWYSDAISVLSGLTNLVMVVSPLILRSRFRTWAPGAAGAGVVSFMIDASWFLSWS
jgi:hypothetical protein